MKTLDLQSNPPVTIICLGVTLESKSTSRSKQLTNPVCNFSQTCKHCPVFRSQHLTDLSSAQENKYWPRILISLTHERCPFNVRTHLKFESVGFGMGALWAISVGRGISQIFIVLSLDAETQYCIPQFLYRSVDGVLNLISGESSMK